MRPNTRARLDWRFLLSLAVLLALGGVGEALAQTSATIRGRVTDDAGDGIVGAAVVATNADTGFTTAAATEENGVFQLGGLQPGPYTILITSTAYEQRTEERTVLVGQTLDVVYKLTPSEVLTEAITVAGSTLWVARLAAGESVTLPEGELLHVYVASGSLLRNSLAEPLAAGDALLISREPEAFEVRAAVDTELLVWRLSTRPDQTT